ncbi:MAG TPA: LCP family protein, partial [Candidatus Dormibacteraeota bacterium]|nr:LCP family protein [Candidatus Dormibacteraeota bacterium]
MTDPSGGPRAPRTSPIIASILSLLWPGLAQAYARRWRIAALFAIPPIVLVAYLAYLARDGIEYLAADLFVPSFAFALVLLALVFIAWRLAALGHAWLTSGTPSSRGSVSARGALLLAAGLIIGSQGVIGYYAWAFYDASNQIFGQDPSPSPGISPSPGQAEASPSGSGLDFGGATPAITPAPSQRLNVLVTGIDAYRTRSEALNDTLLVASIDPVSKTAVLISIPRDTSDFPLYFGGVYHAKINSLMSAVYGNPKAFPDDPVTTLTKEVGYLLGIPIHYYAAIALAGFSQMVDLVGGIDVNNPKPIADSVYDWLDGSPYGFSLSAGPHHLNGRLALAYVRSRYGQGDNDYTRSARQQQVLIALKSKMAAPSMIARLPQLLAAAARTIKTDFPPERVSD